MTGASELGLLLLLTWAPAAHFGLYTLSSRVVTVRRRGQHVEATGLDTSAGVYAVIAALLGGCFMLWTGGGAWTPLLLLLPLGPRRVVRVGIDTIEDVRVVFGAPWRVRRVSTTAWFVDEGWGDEADPTRLEIAGPGLTGVRLATALTAADAARLDTLRTTANAELARLRGGTAPDLG